MYAWSGGAPTSRSATPSALKSPTASERPKPAVVAPAAGGASDSWHVSAPLSTANNETLPGVPTPGVPTATTGVDPASLPTATARWIRWSWGRLLGSAIGHAVELPSGRSVNPPFRNTWIDEAEATTRSGAGLASRFPAARPTPRYGSADT